MSKTEFVMIPINLLVYSGRNPRTEMRGLEEFAENIKEYGILEPIIVRPREEKFEVVVGERRVRAGVIAGLKEAPAIVKALTDRQTDELRLIENIHREDLTDAEKGDAVLSLLENYPDKYPTLKSIAEALNKSHNIIMFWTYKSRRLSAFVKESLAQSRLEEKKAQYLMKYDYSIQDKLAEKIMAHELTTSQTITYLKLYDEKPDANLDELALQAKGFQFVTKLVPAEEVKKKPHPQKGKHEPKERKAKKSKSLKELASKKREARKKTEKPPPPLLPEEEERLEKVTEKERQRIIRERKKKGEFMQAKAELAEEKIELPYGPVLDAPTILSRRRIIDEKKLNLFEAKDWMIFTKSWFIHNPPPRDEKEELHPAKFPEPMIRDFIEFFTQPTEIVLDPFLGTGSALVACDMSNRQGIGVEIEERYVEAAKRRTKQPIIVGDARNLDELPILKDLERKIDFVITSPPYWNMLKKSRGHVRSVSKIREELGADVFYSGKEENLENIDSYEEYLNTLHLIFSKVHKLLRPNRYLVIVIQNILNEEGEMKPVAWDLAKKLSGLFLLKQERIWCQDNKPLGCWGYPYRYVSNVHHHYCLVFEKAET
jgi:ParB/RepB/Spo0J family partition protein